MHSRDFIDRLEVGKFDFDYVRDHDYVGNSTCFCFREHARLYPDAKFIFPQRDADEWLASYEYHLKGVSPRNMDPNTRHYFLTTYGRLKFCPETWKRVYERHHLEVLEFFEQESDRLLIFDIYRGDSYRELCPFLEVPVLGEEFPHSNQSKRRQ